MSFHTQPVIPTADGTRKVKVLLVDNRDSFVYNLLDAFAVAGMDCTVYRNNVDVATILAAEPDLICLSPGPGHPREAGCMMELIDTVLGKIPLLGICLGFQALLEHFGGRVVPCGPVHGITDEMVLTDAGAASPVFTGLAQDTDPVHATGQRSVPIARYHSLGCRFTPPGIVSWAECASTIGPVTMAGATDDGMAIGLQFHPESVLSPSGPHILSRCVQVLLDAAATNRTLHSNHSPKGSSVSGHDQASARLRQFLDNPSPTVEEATAVFEPLTEGIYSDIETAALLTTIRTRGEHPADLAGAARAFIDKAKPFPKDGTGLVDSCGTGGDGAHTINVSTAAALVAASAGVPMVKHGNRSVSSKSGSADVLEALGIPLDLDPEEAAKQLDDANFTFLFAPAYHPAIAHVMPVRKALKVPTVFNVLGPLLNPVRPTIQLMGVANKDICGTVIEVMETLGRTRAMVVHGDGIDEIAVHGPTSVWELNNGEVTTYEITPEKLGLSSHPLSDLTGGDGEHNARILREILAGKGAPAHRDAVAANAGALLYLHGDAETLKEGVAKAGHLIDSGKVLEFVDSHFGASGE